MACFTGQVLDACEVFFMVCLLILAVTIILCLIRAIIGPSIADRIVAVNMTGTMTIAAIAILAVMKRQDYLVDICIIYALLSFLAVIVLTKVFLGVYAERRRQEALKQSKKEEDGK